MPIIDPAFEKDALDLIMAVLLGGVIGFERQWRQRLAGLRTNTLVSLGAAIFVVFAGQFTIPVQHGWPRRSSPVSVFSAPG